MPAFSYVGGEQAHITGLIIGRILSTVIQMHIAAVTHGFQAGAEVGVDLGVVFNEVYSALLLTAVRVGGEGDMQLAGGIGWFIYWGL